MIGTIQDTAFSQKTGNRSNLGTWIGGRNRRVGTDNQITDSRAAQITKKSDS